MVALLYEGRQIYFGPIECARKYFTDLGYICPGRQTTADFLTSLTTPAERIVQPGFENRVPQTSEEFAKVWENSSLFKDTMKEIIHFEEEYPVGVPCPLFRARSHTDSTPGRYELWGIHGTLSAAGRWRGLQSNRHGWLPIFSVLKFRHVPGSRLCLL